VNFYFHSEGLESNPVVKPEDFNASTAPAVNPYNFQEHLYDKSRPENLKFLERLRALMDEYPGKTTVGEIGDSQHQLEVMAQYTSGTNRLHMAYTFDYLGGVFDAGHFRKAIDLTEKDAPDGWICLAFSNHDVVRHVSRWATHGQQEQFTRLAATMLLTMRGSVCLYQGEELGLTEAELAFEDLADPYGIEFWPQFKGRDGCRTPMVWQSQSHLGAFSTSPRAWLPVPADHLARAVDVQRASNDSVLHYYRSMIDFRKRHPALKSGSIETYDMPEGILAFRRKGEGEDLICIYNMRDTAQVVPLPAGLDPRPLDAPFNSTQPVGGTLSLPPFGAYIGAV
jgi:alpha-glucosidase